MTSLNTQKRILALDIRAGRFGYVVFEGPHDLLDWGGNRFPEGVNAVRVSRAKKFVMLLDRFRPSVVVLKEPRALNKLGRFFNSIHTQAKKRRITVRLFSRRVVRNAFADIERVNKYEIASSLAQRFPELAWQLPPKRKFYNPENYRMSIFDAAALGITYFRQEARRKRETPPNELAPP